MLYLYDRNEYKFYTISNYKLIEYTKPVDNKYPAYIRIDGYERRKHGEHLIIYRGTRLWNSIVDEATVVEPSGEKHIIYLVYKGNLCRLNLKTDELFIGVRCMGRFSMKFDHRNNIIWPETGATFNLLKLIRCDGWKFSDTILCGEKILDKYTDDYTNKSGLKTSTKTIIFEQNIKITYSSNVIISYNQDRYEYIIYDNNLDIIHRQSYNNIKKLTPIWIDQSSNLYTENWKPLEIYPIAEDIIISILDGESLKIPRWCLIREM